MRKAGDGRGRLGGRKKGTPNKLTKPMRELLSNFSETTFNEFVKAFHEIEDPKDKCRIWIDVQAYVTPKLAAVDIKPSENIRSLADELEELSRENTADGHAAES